jgi:hypothetical protein
MGETSVYFKIGRMNRSLPGTIWNYPQQGAYMQVLYTVYKLTEHISIAV